MNYIYYRYLHTVQLNYLNYNKLILYFFVKWDKTYEDVINQISGINTSKFKVIVITSLFLNMPLIIMCIIMCIIIIISITILLIIISSITIIITISISIIADIRIHTVLLYVQTRNVSLSPTMYMWEAQVAKWLKVNYGDSRAESCGFKHRVWPQLENSHCLPNIKWVPVGTKVYNTGIMVIGVKCL